MHELLSRGQLNKVFIVDLSGLTDNTEIFTMICQEASSTRCS